MEIKKAFVASVMAGANAGVATKLREEFSKSMIDIHCISHRLALACADTGDDYKFIRSFEENLIKTIEDLYQGSAEVKRIRYHVK